MLTQNKTNILRQHLDSNGAAVVCDAIDLDKFASDDIGQGFVLVPHDVQPDVTSLPEVAGGMSLVTNWWVERCLHGKCLVDPTDVLCRPFDKLSISGSCLLSREQRRQAYANQFRIRGSYDQLYRLCGH